MKIAIHRSDWGFSKEWISYCEREHIDYKVVDCYKNDIIQQVADCDALLWHHHHSDAKDVLFAKGLLFALEQSGMKVFPDFNTAWHFDDKVGQKYLLEAVGAPIPKSWVFYEKKDALDWVNRTRFPKVFKLRGGAGSTNVKLVKSKKQAQRLISKAFGRGFSAYDGWNDLNEQWLRYRQKRLKPIDLLKSIRRLFVSTRYARTVGREKGYIYFQEFIPENNFDIRIIVIGSKAFAIKRMVRPNDFRASGGGNTKYAREHFDEKCVRISFDIASKLKVQCIAYDYVFDKKDNPLIVEISFGFAKEVYYPCSGYWDKEMNWHEGSFNQVEWIVDLIIKE